MKKSEMISAFAAARRAGIAAARACSPKPMIVRDALNPSAPVYRCDDGVCGFAWVRIPDGRSSAARYAKARLGGRSSDYYGGVLIHVHDYNQSYERKSAHARAYAAALRDHGIDAHADGRLD